MQDYELIKANCISIMGTGVLLFGPSGSGKSDLCLRLISASSVLLKTPCKLVADDQTLIRAKEGHLYGTCPPQIAGRLEVRGVGVLRFDYLEEARIGYAVELTHTDPLERIPNLFKAKMELAGIEIPKSRLNPFEASAPEKLISLVMAIYGDALANEI